MTPSEPDPDPDTDPDTDIPGAREANRLPRLHQCVQLRPVCCFRTHPRYLARSLPLKVPGFHPRRPPLLSSTQREALASQSVVVFDLAVTAAMQMRALRAPPMLVGGSGRVRVRVRVRARAVSQAYCSHRYSH